MALLISSPRSNVNVNIFHIANVMAQCHCEWTLSLLFSDRVSVGLLAGKLTLQQRECEILSKFIFLFEPAFCFSVRSSRGNSNGADCKFPFLHNNKEYGRCLISPELSRFEPWCSTTYNYDADKKWGYCICE